jgi:hypothetical protein
MRALGMAKKNTVVLEGVTNEEGKGKEVTVRSFKGKDFAMVARALKKLDVKGVFAETKQLAKQYTSSEDEAAASNIGYELIFGVLGNLGDAEEEIFTVIGNLCECSKEEVEEFEVVDFYNVFMKLKEHKGTKSFLQLVLKSMN